MEDIPGTKIATNEKSKRIINLVIKEEILDKLIFPFHKFDITALEYKPFTRFTLAKSLDELFLSKLSKFICSVLKDRNKVAKINITAIISVRKFTVVRT